MLKIAFYLPFAIAGADISTFGQADVSFIIELNIDLSSLVYVNQLIDIDSVHDPIARHTLLLEFVYPVNTVDFP